MRHFLSLSKLVDEFLCSFTRHGARLMSVFSYSPNTCLMFLAFAVSLFCFLCSNNDSNLVFFSTHFQNFQFWKKIVKKTKQKNKQHKKVLFDSFHLNGRTLVFVPQLRTGRYPPYSLIYKFKGKLPIPCWFTLGNLSLRLPSSKAALSISLQRCQLSIVIEAVIVITPFSAIYAIFKRRFSWLSKRLICE